MTVSCYYCGCLCPFVAPIVYFYEGSCYIILCINIHKDTSTLWIVTFPSESILLRSQRDNSHTDVYSSIIQNI